MKKTAIILFFLLTCTLTFCQKHKFGNVSKEELAEKEHPIEADAEAAYLYKHQQTYFDYNQTEGIFFITSEYYTKVKIYASKGFNKANISIPFYTPDNNDHERITSIKGYTYNLIDGKIQKEKLSRKNIFIDKKNDSWSFKNLTLPNIKVGCVIELKYKLISPYYTYMRALEFQSDIPIKILDYKTTIPEYYKFKKQAVGFYLIKPTLKKKNSSIEWTNKSRSGLYVSNTSYSKSSVDFISEVSSYNAQNIPALRENEPFISNINNYRGTMIYEISSIEYPESIPKYFNTTWEDVTKKIYKSPYFGLELKKSVYFKKDLEQILTNSLSEDSKINKIFNFVKSKVKWNKKRSTYTDKGVKKAYREGDGNVCDINLILTSMLRESGLNANPVLVSTRNHGIPFFPSTKSFNYVVSAVKLESGKYLLLDATEPYAAPGLLPKRVLNWKGRMVAKDGNSSFLPLTPKKHAEETHSLNIKLDEELNVEGVLKSSFTGLEALKYRQKNNGIKEDTHIIKLEDQYGIEIEKFRIINKNKLRKPFSRILQFKKENEYVEKIDGKVYIHPLLFLRKTTNPFKSEERKFPIDYATPWLKKYRVNFDIPKSYRIESIPQSQGVGVSSETGFFKFHVSQKENTLSVTSFFQINEALISPKYYKELKNMYTEMISKHAEKIILVKR